MSTVVLKPYSNSKVRRKPLFRDHLLRLTLILLLFAGAGLVVLKQSGDTIVPQAVDVVRGVIGPEAMAWIQSTFYGGVEQVQQLRQDMGLQQAEQAPWTTAGDTADNSGFVPVIIPTERPAATPSATSSSTATTSPSATATNSPSATRTTKPTSTAAAISPTKTVVRKSLPTTVTTPTPHAGQTATADAVALATAVATMTLPTATPLPPTATSTAEPPTATEAPTHTETVEPTSTATPTETPSPAATIGPNEPHPTGVVESNTPLAGEPASATPILATPTITPVPATRLPAPAGAPASLDLFINDGQLAGEGVWSADGLPTRPGSGEPVFWKTFLRPNPARSYAQVYMVSFKPDDVKLHMVAGNAEPVSTSTVPRGTRIDPTDYSSIVAAFNGGWKSVHGNYGMMVNGVEIAPPQPNAATLAQHADGRLEIGPWSRVGTATDLVSYRQNCPMLIDNNVIRYDKHTVSTWGLSLLDEMYVWRSGLGMTADGRLIYIAGSPISAEEMAWALQRAGAVNAMQLDINSAWVHWVIYDHNDKSEIRARPLVSTMTVARDQYINPVERDFFYITWR